MADAIVPAYLVPSTADSRHRIHRLADAVAILAERLQRLQAALPFWRQFDAGAYFDLRPAQVQTMVHIERLGAVLDITIYADLLSPAFHVAESYWAHSYCPAFYAASVSSVDDAFKRYFQQHTQPAMQAYLDAARDEIAAAGNLLYQRGDLTFLAAAAAPDEQQRHSLPLDSVAYDALILPPHLPSLTLSRSFDLLRTGNTVR